MTKILSAVIVFLVVVVLFLGAINLLKFRKKAGKPGLPAKYLWAIPVVVLLGFGVWWGISSLGSSTAPPVAPSSPGWSLEAPSPGMVWEWTKNYWLWIVLVLAIPFFALFAVKETWAKALQGFLVAVAAMFFVVSPLVHVTWGDESAKPALTLKIPANGNSPNVDTKPGYAIDYTGSGFSIHCVYRDGREGIVGDKTRPCVDGPMLYQYLRDTTGKANTATYAFVRPN